jgi:hypothetical protein
LPSPAGWELSAWGIFLASRSSVTDSHFCCMCEESHRCSLLHCNRWSMRFAKDVMTSMTPCMCVVPSWLVGVCTQCTG